MATLQFFYRTGQTLTYGVNKADGTERTAAGTSFPEIATNQYSVVDPAVETGDVVIIKHGTKPVGGGEANSPVILSSDGLDYIDTTEPTGLASNFRERLIQLYRRFFGKAELTSSTIILYKEDGINTATTQSIAETSTTQSQGEAS